MWKWANGWVVTGVESNASGPLNRHLPFWGGGEMKYKSSKIIKIY